MVTGEQRQEGEGDMTTGGAVEGKPSYLHRRQGVKRWEEEGDVL
jgi:hypothetical protein